MFDLKAKNYISSEKSLQKIKPSVGVYRFVI